MPAWNTSKIDPVTGFVDFLKPKYENVKSSQEFFSKFDGIKYNSEKDYFEFTFDYTNFTAKSEGSRTKWTVCTHGDIRYSYNPQTKASKEVNVTQEIKAVLEKHNIQYQNSKDFKNQLIQQQEKEIHSDLLYFLAITLNMRQTKSGTDIDFILSPVASKEGVFYDSRNADNTLPKDADANCAYHIALKGLFCLQQIINKTDDLKKLKLAISNKEWLQFAQSKEYQNRIM